MTFSLNFSNYSFHNTFRAARGERLLVKGRCPAYNDGNCIAATC
jgi:hypothetical protein